MRNMLIVVFATGIAAGAEQAVVLDQSQEELTAVISIHQSRAFFQVFKPSVDGHLDHVDVHLQMLDQAVKPCSSRRRSNIRFAVWCCLR